MKNIIKNFICYFVAMILLLFGVSFDKAETLILTSDSSLECFETGVGIEGTILCEASYPTAKLMETHSDSPVQQITKQSDFSQKDTKASFDIFQSDIISDNNSHSVSVTNVTESTDLCYGVAILSYIHDLDGKKRLI